MSKESIQGPLTALRNAGTVSGVCLVRGTEMVVNLFPFSGERMNEVVSLIDDILEFIANQGRQVDQLCFGYDGGNLVIVADEDYRLIVMHMLSDEIDFIAKAARAFLIDFQVGLFAEQLSGQNPRLTGAGLTRELPPVIIPGETSEPETGTGTVPDTGGAAPVVPKGQPAVAAAAPDPEPEPRIIPSPGVERAREEEAPRNRSPEAADNVSPGQGAHLAPNQPESTLPPPRKPRDR